MALHIVSWNIQKGIGTDFRRDLDRTTRVLAGLGADIIGLQEVLRTEEVDQAATLARALDMQLAWGPARALRNGTFGNALLVRGEVRSHRVHDLSVPRMEARVCLEALVATPTHTVRMFVCHFGLGPRERAKQTSLLVEILRAAPLDAPRVVLGDFNEWYRGPAHRAFETEFPNTSERKPTHPSPLPIFALDRIAWDDPLRGSAYVRPVDRASDHRLIHATLS
jgi:endonuclease/exonuclease/phosphatase family metal-dependent hydrolase